MARTPALARVGNTRAGAYGSAPGFGQRALDYGTTVHEAARLRPPRQPD